MKSTDFLGKLPTLAIQTLSLSFARTHTRSSPNWTLSTGSWLVSIQRVHTDIYFHFSFGFDPIVVGRCLVWWRIWCFSLRFSFFYCCMCAKNICKYHAIWAYVSSGAHCISYPYTYTHSTSYTNSHPHSHLHPIHHSVRSKEMLSI